MIQTKKGEIYMKETKNRKKDEVMKQVLQLMLQLNEDQQTLIKGVMTGMILEHSLKENEKGKVS